jgi:hypothetical protein
VINSAASRSGAGRISGVLFTVSFTYKSAGIEGTAEQVIEVR